MNVSLPRYKLFSNPGSDHEDGRWRFVLREVGGARRFEATDVESDVRGQRLELLAIVRGLESLEQPSAVTLMTASCSVREGISYGLKQWRENDWRWECFGQLVPVKNRDLWQRVDRALGFHRIDCHTWRVDSAHASNFVPKSVVLREKGYTAMRLTVRRRLRYRMARFIVIVRRRVFPGIKLWRRQLAHAWATLEPCA